MTETYRTTELENARREYTAARSVYDSQPKWNAKKRDASERLEFWGNKVAFLNAIKAETSR